MPAISTANADQEIETASISVKPITRRRRPVSKKIDFGEEETDTPAPVVAPVVVTTPNLIVVPTPVAVPEPVVEAPVIVDEITVHDTIAELEEILGTLTSRVKALSSTLKQMKSLYTKEAKQFLKKNKTKRTLGTPSKHGFNKPVHISEELSSFLGLEPGTLLTRPKAANMISVYVRKHSLQNPDNGSIFRVDNKLKSVLGEPVNYINPKAPESGLGYSYKNLQKYLTRHFFHNKLENAVTSVN